MRRVLLPSVLLLAAAAIVLSRAEAASRADRADAETSQRTTGPSPFAMGALTLAGFGALRLRRKRRIAGSAGFQI